MSVLDEKKFFSKFFCTYANILKNDFWEWLASTFFHNLIHTYFCQKELFSECWQLERRFWPHQNKQTNNKKKKFISHTCTSTYCIVTILLYRGVVWKETKGTIWEIGVPVMILLRLLLAATTPSMPFCSAWAPVSLVSAFLPRCISLPVKWCAV